MILSSFNIFFYSMMCKPNKCANSIRQPVFITLISLYIILMFYAPTHRQIIQLNGYIVGLKFHVLDNQYSLLITLTTIMSFIINHSGIYCVWKEYIKNSYFQICSLTTSLLVENSKSSNVSGASHLAKCLDRLSSEK